MATKNILTDIKNNPSQILPDLWGNLNAAVPGLFNPATSPLNINNALGQMAQSAGQSIAGGVNDTLATGAHLMNGQYGTTVSPSQFISPQQLQQNAAQTAQGPLIPGTNRHLPLAPFMNDVNSAANMGGVVTSLGGPKLSENSPMPSPDASPNPESGFLNFGSKVGGKKIILPNPSENTLGDLIQGAREGNLDSNQIVQLANFPEIQKAVTATPNVSLDDLSPQGIKGLMSDIEPNLPDQYKITAGTQLEKMSPEDALSKINNPNATLEDLNKQALNIQGSGDAIKNFEEATRMPYPRDQAGVQNVLNEMNKAQAAGEWGKVKTIGQAIMSVPDNSPLASYRQGMYSTIAHMTDPSAFKPSGLDMGSESGNINFGAKVGGADETPPADQNQPVNTWSPYISDQAGNPNFDVKGNMIENPNYTGGSASPTQYSITPPHYPETPTDTNLNPAAGVGSTIPEANPEFTRPEVPPQPPLSLRQKAIAALNGTDNYQLGEGYAGKRIPLEAQDQSVMQNVIGGNTADQVLKNSLPAQNKVWSQIEDSIKSAPPTPTSTILNNIKGNLQYLADQGLINDEQLTTALNKEAINIRGADVGTDPAIDGQRLIDLRTGASKTAAGGLDRYGNLKDTANAQQMINKAIKDGYSTTMGNINPQTQFFYNQYSSIKRIQQMPNSFRNQSLGGSIPLINKPVPGIGTLRRIGASALKGDPIALAGVGIPAAAAGIQIAKGLLPNMEDSIANTLGYSRKNLGTQEDQNRLNGTQNSHQDPNPYDNQQPSHVSDIPQKLSDVKPTPQGSWSVVNPDQIKDANENPLIVNPNDAKTYIAQQHQLISKLQQQMSQNPLDNSLHQKNTDLINAANTNIANEQGLAADPNDLVKKAQFTNTLAGVIDDTKKMLTATSPNLTSLNGTIDAMRTALDPHFAQLSQDLATIKGQLNTAGLNGATKQVLEAELNKIGQTVKFAYGQAALNYSGGATTPIGQSSSDLAPAPSTYLPAISGSNSGMGVAHPFSAPPSLQTLPSLP